MPDTLNPKPSIQLQAGTNWLVCFYSPTNRVYYRSIATVACLCLWYASLEACMPMSGWNFAAGLLIPGIIFTFFLVLIWSTEALFADQNGLRIRRVLGGHTVRETTYPWSRIHRLQDETHTGKYNTFHQISFLYNGELKEILSGINAADARMIMPKLSTLRERFIGGSADLHGSRMLAV